MDVGSYTIVDDSTTMNVSGAAICNGVVA